MWSVDPTYSRTRGSRTGAAGPLIQIMTSTAEENAAGSRAGLLLVGKSC